MAPEDRELNQPLLCLKDITDPCLAETLNLSRPDHLEGLLAVGALAVFYPVLCERPKHEKHGKRDIGSVELGGYRCHFLWIMHILSERYSLTKSGEAYGALHLLEGQLSGFAHAVAAYALRVKHEDEDEDDDTDDDTDGKEAEDDDDEHAYLRQDRVAKALNGCLDEFWPRRQWLTRDVTLPAGWQASRPFIDIRGIVARVRQTADSRAHFDLEQFVKARSVS